jgi:hypothetical protein
VVSWLRRDTRCRAQLGRQNALFGDSSLNDAGVRKVSFLPATDYFN